MALHRTVSCDTPDCLALYLAVPKAGPDAALFAARRAGWDVSSSGLTMHCPSCTTSGHPVHERGTCPTCSGATHDGRQGEVCHYCGSVRPFPTDEDDELEAVVDEDQEHVDHHRGSDVLTVVRTEGSRP